MQQQLGANYRADRFDPVIQKQVLDTLIEEAILKKLAEDNNIHIGDDELSAILRKESSFFKDGKFDFDTYKIKISQLGFAPQDYEEILRTERRYNIVPRLIRSSSFVTEQEASRYHKLLMQKRTLDYVLVESDSFKEESSVSDAEARAYYEAHLKEFVRPEQVKLEYVRLSASSLEKTIEVTEEALKEFYELNIDRYVVDEQREASHILLNLPEGKNLEDAPEVNKKLAEIQAKLKAGEDFGVLAKQYSQDTGSADKNGSLGQVLRGQMVPPFEEELYALTEVGQISPPVRSSFGIHLIRLDGVTPRQTKAFADVKAELQASFAAERAIDRFFNLAERVAELSYENPGTLQPVADTLNLPLQTSDWIARNNQAAGISGNQDILEAAFSERLKGSGANSEPIEVGVNDLVVFRVADSRPQTQISFADARARVVQAARKKKDKDRLSAYTATLVERIKKGESMESVAADEKLTPVLDVTVDREGKGTPAGLVRNVFKMKAPRSERDSVTAFELSGNKQAVVHLKKVTSPDDDHIPPQLIAGLNRRIAAQDASNYLTEVRLRADVVINKENIE